ncbi:MULTISPECIES: hypothetical protein [unclassified Bacillus (in: firmicutes)]|uniref:hypothetical protein n=1 Tax=unclassified Bacillus (in: firmicutes) TaxID=185979 RepID=UPI0015965864|nr:MULTISPECIES: hypothetical protein [unclassified Bacillus (in: firmicutes)]
MDKKPMETWTERELMYARENNIYDCDEAIRNNWFHSARAYINTLEKINNEIKRREAEN